jgi:hypothetical protein
MLVGIIPFAKFPETRLCSGRIPTPATAQQLLDLSNNDRDKISGLGWPAASTLQVHRALAEHPIATSGRLVEKTGVTPATVNKILGVKSTLDSFKI